MLTRLRFKNWRSLRDVEIPDLTPITVFIGANSSGKTNILDALRFQRDSMIKGILQVVLETGYNRIQTDTSESNEDIELEFSYKLHLSTQPVTQKLVLQFDKRDVPFKFGSCLYEGDVLLLEEPRREFPTRSVIESFVDVQIVESEQHEARARELSNFIYPLVQKRWQILGDNFVAPVRLSRHAGGDPYVIESDAHNTLIILDFMQRVHPGLYRQLEEDLRWILHHVNRFAIMHPREELEMRIQESNGKSASTISAGTIRLIAMLTAVYALDMPQEISSQFNSYILTPDMPGLVVIEEPDTALNPGILSNFVEQLRSYVDREDRPRQFILTTHNPAFLDLFKPEEVRIVERDEQGYTTVKKIPDYVEKIWLDEYGLGEVWTTNSFGGLPE